MFANVGFERGGMMPKYQAQLYSDVTSFNVHSIKQVAQGWRLVSAHAIPGMGHAYQIIVFWIREDV